MPNLNINSGEIKLTVNDDENRVIRFNPNDIAFAEKFYSLISDFEEKEQDYDKRAKELDENKELDKYGIPKNTKEKLEFTREVCGYIKEQIDNVFGAGTSKAAFGDACEIEMFEQFFNGITPFVNKARTEKVKKYGRQGEKGVMR